MTNVLELLIAEREKLNRAIEALSGGGRRGRPPGRRGRPPGRAAARRERRGMSAEARAAQSRRMRLYWARRRKEKAKGTAGA